MNGLPAQSSNLNDGRNMRRDTSRRTLARASTSRPEDGKSTHPGTHPPPRQRTAEDERARAAAKQAEKEMWERTRGAGSSVFKLADSGRIQKRAKVDNSATAEEWKAEDVLPSLEEVEGKRYEIVEVPSIDVLLSRGICDYTLLPKTLGRGKFSTVFMASKGGVLSAIKHTALFPHHQLISTRLLREPTLLAELPPHPNLVAVKETIRTPGHFYLVEEFLDNYVTLEALLPMLSDSQPPIMPVSAAEKILTQLLSAVHAIHVPLQICHRDIKPENILVHPDTLQLKLLDFGLATHFSKSEPKLSTCCGSPAFHCPEIVKALASPPGSVLYMGPEVDAWTCGVTMLRCLTGQRFPLGASHSSLRGMAIRAQRAVATIGDESLRSKVSALLDMDGTKRMKRFEELVAEQEKVLGQPSREGKSFKSTTFIPAEPTHSIQLPLFAPHLIPDVASLSTSGFITPAGPGSTSRRTTPASSRPPSPSRSPSLTPTTAATSHIANIVALNPTHQPPERVLSYIKYCLRCAGILYHTWPEKRAGSGKERSNSPVNYFHPGHPSPNPSAPAHSSNAAFAEAVGAWSEQQVGPSPFTPLPTHVVDEGAGDEFSNVQLFQCVMEASDEKDGKEGGGEQLSLVQSIMAAFTRRKPAPSPSSSGSSRPEAKRSHSQPVRERNRDTVAAASPGTPSGSSSRQAVSKDGTVRCLAFHIIVRFPKSQSTVPSGRLRGTSRANSNMSLGQQAATNSLSAYGRHSRANSGGTLLPSLESLAHVGADGGERRSINSVGGSVDTQNGRARDTEAEEGKLHINTDTAVLPSPVSHAFPRLTSNRSPSSSRAPSRTRKKSHRGQQKKAKVLIQVTDQRALQAVRDALSVGGTIDSLEGEDYFNLSHSNRFSLPASATAPDFAVVEGAEPHTPSKSDQRRKYRAQTLTPVGRHGHGTNEETSRTPRASDDISRETPRASRSTAVEEEEEHRGRQRGDIRSRGAPVIGKKAGVRPPSQLSKVALKEEAGNDDTFKQAIESLDSVLQMLTGSAKTNVAEEASIPSPGPATSDRNISSGSSSSSTPASTSYVGGESAAQQQVRTLLTDVCRRLHNAEHTGASAMEDLVSPVSFELFSALSPALGLEAQETWGLPAAGGLPISETTESTTLRGLAVSALDVVARFASPREMFMAAQERLVAISTARHAKAPSEEDECLLQVPPVSPAEITDRTTRTLSISNEVWSSGLEVAGLIRFLSIVVPRIKTQKPMGFLQPLSIAIPRAVRSSLRAQPELTSAKSWSDLASDHSNSNPQTPSTDGESRHDGQAAVSSTLQRIATSAGEIVIAIAELVRSLQTWTGTFEETERDQARPLVHTLFFSCVIVVMPALPKIDGYTSLSEPHFHQWWPIYAFRRQSQAPTASKSSSSGTPQLRGWCCLEESVVSLGVDLERCAFQRPKSSMAQDKSTAAAIMTMGAFILHINLLARAIGKQVPKDWNTEQALQKLQEAMPILLASLGSGPPATISADGLDSLGGSSLLSDAALTWSLWCIQGIKRGEASIGPLLEADLLPVIQMLSSHAALCPDPPSRLIALKLAEALLDSSITPESLGREVLRDLIVESPFPQLRSASVGLAKQLIASDLERATERFACRPFLQTIASTLFTLPSSTPLPEEATGILDVAACKHYLDDHGAWLSECLGLIFFVYTRDQDNRTGIADDLTVHQIQHDLLNPLHRWLLTLSSASSLPTEGASHKATTKEEAEVSLQSSVLLLAIERAREALLPASTSSST